MEQSIKQWNSAKKLTLATFAVTSRIQQEISLSSSFALWGNFTAAGYMQIGSCTGSGIHRFFFSDWAIAHWYAFPNYKSIYSITSGVFSSTGMSCNFSVVGHLCHSSLFPCMILAIRVGAVIKQVKPLHTALASHLEASSSPGCSTLIQLFAIAQV